MAATNQARAKRRSTSKSRPLLELHLSRTTFATGRRLSGVVTFRLGKPTSIGSLAVSVTGCETPTGASLARRLRRPGAFFHREVILSGREQPRRTYERASQLWNAFLGRDRGRILSAGEHTYPFSVTLPAALPPTYQGRAGNIDYRVTARVRFPLRSTVQISTDVPVVLVPRIHKVRPVALSYPRSGGTFHSSETSVSLELAQRTVQAGMHVKGRFTVNNPQRVSITQITVSLESCEWVKLAAEREMQREVVGECVLEPQQPNSSLIESEFELEVPAAASPTIEGTAISVIWLLKLWVNTSPPIELKTPITVYAPLPN